MSIFGSILKTAFDVATLPIDAAKDVVTLGGILTDESQPYTFTKQGELEDDLEDIADDLGNL